MKIVEEFEIPQADPRRFEITARTSNQLLLRDNEMRKLYRVDMEEDDMEEDDWRCISRWGDNEWWHFIYITEARYEK